MIKQLHPKRIFSKSSGGISNINIPPSDASDALGFDVGPGNCLLDLAVQQLFNLGFRDFFHLPIADMAQRLNFSGLTLA